MIDDAALDRSLEAWLKSADAGLMSDDSVDGALVRARSLRQRGTLALAVFGPATYPRRPGFGSRPAGQWIATGFAAVAVFVAVVIVANLLGPRNSVGPVPVATPSSTATQAAETAAPTLATVQPSALPRPSAAGSGVRVVAVDLEDQGHFQDTSGHAFNLPGGVLLTSRVFDMPITFKARVRETETDRTGSD